LNCAVRKSSEGHSALPSKEFDRDYDTTRNELIWRLRLLMENDFIRTMLNAPMTKFILKKEMDDGKIIIINNSQGLLDKDGAEFFARFFIAQIWNAATARSLQTYKKPCYVYIDEAQNVIRRDEMIASIIDECRSQKIALILAHQRVAQIESKNVLSALSNCAIRISNSDEEADYFASVLRTEPEHLHSLNRGQFAVFVRDLTKHAFTMDVTPADFSSYRRLSLAEQEQLKQKMTNAYGYVPESKKPQPVAPASVQIPRVEKIDPKKDPSTPAPWGKV
jgi:TraM recognition site of TraD and TraG